MLKCFSYSGCGIDLPLDEIGCVSRSVIHADRFLVLGRHPNMLYSKKEDVNLLPLKMRLKVFPFIDFFDEYVKKEYSFFDLSWNVFKLTTAPKKDTPPRSFQIIFKKTEKSITFGGDKIILFENFLISKMK